MATWVVHLRLADKIIKSGAVPCQYKKEFITGSLAPDCGYGAKDSLKGFSPPSSVTHWSENGLKFFCRYDNFYNEYLRGKRKTSDYYFYLGYFSHLVCDVLWANTIFQTTENKYKAEFIKNPEFINTVKKDWYDLDFKFLKENPGFEPYIILKNTTAVKDYLPYYESGQLTKQISYIRDYYDDKGSHITERKYTFLTQNEVGNFLEKALLFFNDCIKKLQAYA